MVLEFLNAIPQQYSTAILLVLLLAAFIAAFKLLEMVFETLLVSVLSAATYAAFTRLVYGSMAGLNDILLFAFAGASLYIGYTLLSSAYGVAAKVIGIPYRVVKVVAHSVWVLAVKLKNMGEDRKEVKRQQEDEKEVKEVVLDKMKGEEKEEEN